MAEVDAARLLHRGDKILDRRGVIVMPPDIQVHPAAEAFADTPARILERLHKVRPGRLKRGGETEHDRGQSGNSETEQQDRHV